MTTDPKVVMAQISRRMWKNTIFLAGIIYLIVATYLFIQNAFQLSVGVFTEGLRGTAALLIILSFAMSGFCYFFDFLDKYIAYRKEWGVMGMLLAVGYAISLLFTQPNVYLYGFWTNLSTPDFILGLTAVTILVSMFVVTNVGFLFKAIGPRNWRRYLRLGYLALLLLVIRAFILDQQIWVSWVHTPLSYLPPLSFILSILTIVLFIMRISIDVSKFIHQVEAHQNKKNFTPLPAQLRDTMSKL